MAFNADLLYQKYQGQTLSYDGIPANAGQCAQWAEYVLTDKQYGYGLQPFWGNAIDWWNNYGGSLLAFDRLTDGTIKKGDIVIFNSKVGSVYGHIDMAMSDGTYAQFTGADSNWAGNKTVHLVNHVGSQYVQGVLRLKGTQTLPQRSDLMDEPSLNYMHFDYLGRQIDKSKQGGQNFLKECLGKPFLHARDILSQHPEYLARIKKAAEYDALQTKPTPLAKGLYQVD